MCSDARCRADVPCVYSGARPVAIGGAIGRGHADRHAGAGWRHASHGPQGQARAQPRLRCGRTRGERHLFREGSAVQVAADGRHGEGGAKKAAQVQESAALADPSTSRPESAEPTVPESKAPIKPLDTSALTVPTEGQGETDSTVSRRKSVRMAPDVKLPPDTPTEDSHATPRGNEHGGQDPMAARGSQLSSRIAPPLRPQRLNLPRRPGRWIWLAVDSIRAGRAVCARPSTAVTRKMPMAMDTRAPGRRLAPPRADGARQWARPSPRRRLAMRRRFDPRRASPPRRRWQRPRRVRLRRRLRSDTSRRRLGRFRRLCILPKADLIRRCQSAAAPSSSTLYTAKAPGSSVGASPAAVPSASMYSVTACVGSERKRSQPAATASAPAQAPAPLTASNLSALDTKDRPVMPPVPQAPPVAGQSNMTVPTAPPPAIAGNASSTGSKGFFRRFKRNK